MENSSLLKSQIRVFLNGIVIVGLGIILWNTALARTHTVPSAFREIAQAHQVPPTILYAVAMNETKTKLASSNVKPWPWSINVAGKGYHYASKLEACQAFHRFAKRYPLKNIDIGIAQVNVGWNGKRFFRSTCDGFEPYTNLHAASIILSECRQRHQSWVSAAGCYHHPAGGNPAEKYKSGIRANLKQIRGIDNSPSGMGNAIETARIQLQEDRKLITSTQKTISSQNRNVLIKSPNQNVRLVSSSPVNWIQPTAKNITWVTPSGSPNN